MINKAVVMVSQGWKLFGIDLDNDPKANRMCLLNAHGLKKKSNYAFFWKQELVAIDELAGGLASSDFHTYSVILASTRLKAYV